MDAVRVTILREVAPLGDGDVSKAESSAASGPSGLHVRRVRAFEWDIAALFTNNLEGSTTSAAHERSSDGADAAIEAASEMSPPHESRLRRRVQAAVTPSPSWRHASTTTVQVVRSGLASSSSRGAAANR